MINNKIIKKISDKDIYFFDKNFFIDVYFNASSSSFIKAKFIKVCFLPLRFSAKRPIHLNKDFDNNKKSYSNSLFDNSRKNRVQSNFYSKNIVTGNLQEFFQDNLIEKSNVVSSDVIKNTLKIKKTTVSRVIPATSTGYNIFVYVLDENKKIIDSHTITNKIRNIFDDYVVDNNRLVGSIIDSYSIGVNIVLEDYTIQNDRIIYGNSGPTLYVPGFTNRSNNDNILQENNLEIILRKKLKKITMSSNEIFEVGNEDDVGSSYRVQNNNVLLRRKILSNYNDNIIKELFNTIKEDNLEKSSLDLLIKSGVGCYTKSIEISKSKALSLYNSFLIRHKDRHTFENFRGKYTYDDVNVDGSTASDEGVLRHDFISLDSEFLESIVMNQTKFVTIEFYSPNLNNKFCFYLDDTLNPQNKITPHSIESGKAVYLIETLYNDSAYYTKFGNGIKSIFCNNIQVYPENVAQDFDEEVITTVDNDFLNVSNVIADSIISNNLDENDEIFLDRSLIEKSLELLTRLKYETDDSGVLMSDLLNNTIVKTATMSNINREVTENITYEKLSDKVNSVNNNLYGIRLASTSSNVMSANMTFIVFEKGTLSGLYNDNPTNEIKESYCKTLNNIAPTKFSKIDASIQKLSIRNDKNNSLEFEKIFKALDNVKSLKKKNVTKEDIQENLIISKNQNNIDPEGIIIPVKKDINILGKEEIIKKYGQYTIDNKFYSINTLLEYKNKSLNITRNSKSNLNSVSVDLNLIKKELGFNINKKDLQIYYHVNLGFSKNKKLKNDNDTKQNSYIVDKQYFNFIQLFNFNIIEEKLIIRIDEKAFKFNKMFYEKANMLFGVNGRLMLENVLQRFLIIFESQEKEEYFVLEENIIPSIEFKDIFRAKNKDKLNINLNQKSINHPNIRIKMV